MAPPAPTHIGGFKIERLLGRGGMGQVYLARQASLDRLVAIKTLLPELANDAEFLQRFGREAKAAALFQHPNVVTVIDAGRDPASGVCYIAFEFIEGGSLEGLLARRGKLSEREALQITHGVLMGLAFAESKGIVHRDIKPDNILLGLGDVPKLADLGLVKMTGDQGAGQLTQTGAVMGTPLYMSPEQGLGEALDIRADLYSVGLCLWHMLSGEVPYKAEGDSALQILSKHINRDLQDVREVEPSVSEGAARLIGWLAAREKDDRYATAAAAANDVARVLGGRPPVGPKRAAGLGATAAVPTGAVAALSAARSCAPTLADKSALAVQPSAHPSAVTVTSGEVAEVQSSGVPLPVVVCMALLVMALGAGLALVFQPSEPGVAAVDAPTDPAPTDPAPTDPAPTDPAQTDPAPGPRFTRLERQRLQQLATDYQALLGYAPRDVEAAAAGFDVLEERRFPVESFSSEARASVEALYAMTEASFELIDPEDQRQREAARLRLQAHAKASPTGPLGGLRVSVAKHWLRVASFGDRAQRIYNRSLVGRRLAFVFLVSREAPMIFGKKAGQLPLKVPDAEQVLTHLASRQGNPVLEVAAVAFLVGAVDGWQSMQPREREIAVGLARQEERIVAGALGRYLEADVEDAAATVLSLAKADDDDDDDDDWEPSLLEILYGLEVESEGEPSPFLRARLLPESLKSGSFKTPGGVGGVLVILADKFPKRRKAQVVIGVADEELVFTRRRLVFGSLKVDFAEEEFEWGARPVILLEALEGEVYWAVGNVHEGSLETEGDVMRLRGARRSTTRFRVRVRGVAVEGLRVLRDMTKRLRPGHR